MVRYWLTRRSFATFIWCRFFRCGVSSDAWCPGSRDDHGEGDAGLSQVRIVRLIRRSPSVVYREIARHTGPDGEFWAEEADRSKPVMDTDMNFSECIGSYIQGVCCCVTRVVSQCLAD